MKKILLLAGWLLGWAAAQDHNPPQRQVLPNGIPLVVQESYSTPTCSLNIFIRVGSVFEKPALNGISHFYEHMFFRGTPTRSGLRFKREIEALGGLTNATTGRDYTHFYINLPKQYLRQGLEILADAYLNAECSQESVDAERAVVLEEYNLGLNQPARQMSDKIYSLVFSQHPYGRSIIGTIDNLNKIGRSELLQFKRDYYVPARTRLVVSGDVDSQEVVAHCRELFGGYQAKGAAEERLPLQTPPPETVVIEEVAKGQGGRVAFAFLGPGVKERKDVLCVDLISFLLGNSKASLLAQAGSLEEPRVDYLTQAFPGVVVISAEAKSGQEPAVVKHIEGSLQQLMSSSYSDKDLKRAKKALSTLYRRGLETNAGKADNWGVYETIDKLEFSKTYLQDIEALSKSELAAAAKKYFSQPHYRLIYKSGKPA